VKYCGSGLGVLRRGEAVFQFSCCIGIWFGLLKVKSM
jgi:hypothetical protein